MTPFLLTASPGADGKLHLAVPVPPGEYQVEVIVRPLPPVKPAGTPESRGWPPGFFERTAGSMPDFSIEPRNQGEYEVREPLE